MSLPSFYLSPSAWGNTVTLCGQEAKHLHQVLRLRVGESVLLLDGQGRSGVFSITAASKQDVTLTQTSETVHPKPASEAYLALALSKAVRRGFFLEKAVELGASGVWFWQGLRSQGKLTQATLEAVKRQILAGAKQSQNPWLPEVAVYPAGLMDVLIKASSFETHILPWELEDPANSVQADLLGRPGKTIYIIGPEGGFADEELEMLAEANYTKVSLGPRILRCETAATLCLGLHYWASFRNAGNPS